MIFAVLVELVEQLPAEPLTPVELVVVVLVFDTVALLLQLYAFATFGVIVGAKIIANILAVEMAIAINRVTLIIHIITSCQVLKESAILTPW